MSKNAAGAGTCSYVYTIARPKSRGFFWGNGRREIDAGIWRPVIDRGLNGGEAFEAAEEGVEGLLDVGFGGLVEFGGAGRVE